MKVLQSGIDSLNLGYGVEYYGSDNFDRLEKAKEFAQLKQYDSSGCPVNWCGINFNVLPRGTRGYEWVLSNGDMDVRIARKCKSGKVMPEVYVVCRSVALWRDTPVGFVNFIRDWIAKWCKIVYEQVSRVDLCVDLAIDYPDINPSNQVITRSKVNSNKGDVIPYSKYRYGVRPTNLVFGKSDIVGRIYDKVVECKMHQKEYVLDDLRTKGWDETTGVTRVEFQLRRDYLRDIYSVLPSGLISDKGIGDFDELLLALSAIWKYLTNTWLRICEDVDRNHNQQKAKLTKYWIKVKHSFDVWDSPNSILKKKVIRCRYEHLFAQAKGCISSMCALLSGYSGNKMAMIAVRGDLQSYINSRVYRESIDEKINRFITVSPFDSSLLDHALDLGFKIDVDESGRLPTDGTVSGY